MAFFLALISVYAQEDNNQENNDVEKNDSIFGNIKEKISWAVHGGIFYFAVDSGVQGADPAPIIPSLGGSISYPILDFLRADFSEDIYLANYEWNSTLGMPMPCSLDSRSAMVLGFVTGFQLTGFYPIGETGIIPRVSAGLAMDIRIIFLAFGLNHPDDYTGGIESNVELQTEAIRSYLWSNGRWFYPVIGVGIDYTINRKFLLGLDFRIWIPVSDNELRFGFGLRITPRKDS